MEIVRVLRIIEYVGTREWVERTVSQSIQGEKTLGRNQTIRAATLGTFPEILHTEDEPAAAGAALPLEEAKRQKRCRICGEPDTGPLVLNYGAEYAHPDCLEKWKEQSKVRSRGPQSEAAQTTTRQHTCAVCNKPVRPYDHVVVTTQGGLVCGPCTAKPYSNGKPPNPYGMHGSRKRQTPTGVDNAEHRQAAEAGDPGPSSPGPDVPGQ